MSLPNSGDARTDKVQESPIAAAAEEGVYRAVLGAILVVLVLIIVLTFASPIANYRYNAICSKSLEESGDRWREARTSIEIQTVLFISAIAMAAVFWRVRGDKIGLAVLGGVAAMVLGLLLLRTYGATHLNWYFGLLSLLCVVITVLAGLCGWKALGREDYIGLGVFVATGAVFLMAGAGAATVVSKVETGDDAQKILDDVRAAYETMIADLPQ